MRFNYIDDGKLEQAWITFASNMLWIKELEKDSHVLSIPERFAFMSGDNNKTHSLPIGRDESNWQSAEIDLRVWETAWFNHDFYGAREQIIFILFQSYWLKGNVSL